MGSIWVLKPPHHAHGTPNNPNFFFNILAHIWKTGTHGFDMNIINIFLIFTQKSLDCFHILQIDCVE